MVAAYDKGVGGLRELAELFGVSRSWISGVVAAMVTRQAINSITFVGFLEEFLAPQLKPGDIVVMDNLSVNKVKGVEEALQAVGAQAWYLPP